MALALRYHLARVPWTRQVVVHMLGVLVYSVVHITVLLSARWMLFQEGRPASFPTFWNYARLTYLMQLDWLLMTYLFLVGLAHALAYRGESEARTLDAAHLVYPSAHQFTFSNLEDGFCVRVVIPFRVVDSPAGAVQQQAGAA